MHSNNPVYGGDDEAQYPFAGTWNKVRGFLEENIQLFQEKSTKNIQKLKLTLLIAYLVCFQFYDIIIAKVPRIFLNFFKREFMVLSFRFNSFKFDLTLPIPSKSKNGI